MDKQKDFELELTAVIFSIAKSVFSFSVKPDKIDILHQALRKVETIICRAAERKAVAVAEKVQQATSDGFANFAQDMASLEKQIKEIKEHVHLTDSKTFPLKPLPSMPPAGQVDHHLYEPDEFED